jgi:hypothetical protein
MSCPVPTSSPVLSVLGDQANYSLAPGGSFENGAPGWSLTDASIVPGNEPWYVGGSSDSRSLNIQTGGSANSASGCGNNLFPTWRFFAKSADGSATSHLRVGVQWTTSWGFRGYTPITTLSGTDYASWQATPSLPLGSLIPGGLTLTGRLVFSADGGAWNIDDVYVDPYAR